MNKVFFSYSFEHQNIVENYYTFFSKHAAKPETGMEPDIFFYEKVFHKEKWDKVLKKELDETDIFVFFAGTKKGNTQLKELNYWKNTLEKKPQQSILVEIEKLSDPKDDIHSLFGKFVPYYEDNNGLNFILSFETLYSRIEGRKFRSYDGLPTNSQIFNYEKDIINFYTKKSIIDEEIRKDSDLLIHADLQDDLKEIAEKLKQGTPPVWPDVPINERVEINEDGNETYVLGDNPLLENHVIGDRRDREDRVVAAALTKYHEYDSLIAGDTQDEKCGNFCMRDRRVSFPEAGPRELIYIPENIYDERHYNVAILVSGGIAPGVNALIDSITRRHYKYAEASGYEDKLQVFGLKNGFQSFGNELKKYELFPYKEKLKKNEDEINTSEIISQGGSKIGTSRVDDLEKDSIKRNTKLKEILKELKTKNVNILYVIGGEGSMKAAHALYSLYEKLYPGKENWRFNVVGIPKTMDNDILWVWQTFGFMSAVEKAREFIDYLAVETESNPRLGIMQLFGSNSGYVVSHAVLASRTGICDYALIPESPFSLEKLIIELKKRFRKKKHGLIIMSETAIPVDAEDYLKNYKSIILLSAEEEKALEKYFSDGKSIKGHIDDKLRDASFKIVKAVIEKEVTIKVLANEPRHLIRAIPPSTIDIIHASRLGILAVDNALAGYTDFMISQWLTEYCLIPLDLVVLGRKRIPKDGIFWKSVIAKTEQEEDLLTVPKPRTRVKP